MIFGQKIINILACLSKVKKNWVQFWQFSQKANLALHKRAAHEGIKHPCRQCDYEATTKRSLDKHKRAIHEGVKYPCRQCNYEATATGDLTKHEKQYMKESNTIVGNAANNFLRRKILPNIKG